MIDQRQINELTARLAKLETMLQNNDAYSPPGAVKLADMDLGPSLDLSVPDYTNFMNQAQPDIAWDPQFSSEQQAALQDENFGFGPTDTTITDLQQRLNDLETFVAGGSNDTNQSDALDAGAEVGDDGATGSGEPPAATAESLGLGTMAYQSATALSVSSAAAWSFANTLAVTPVTSLTTTAPTTTIQGSGSGVQTITIGTTSAAGTHSLSISTGSTPASSLSMSGSTFLLSMGGYNMIGCSSGTTQLDVGTVSFATVGLSGTNINIGTHSSSSGTRIGHSTSTLNFFAGASAGNTKQTVTGSRGGNAALASLLTALAAYGLLTDSSS